MSDYNVGDLALLTATFKLVADGSKVPPTTVVITVQKPDKTQVTPSVTNPSLGVYQVSVLTDLGGTWRWHAVGTGAVQAARYGAFEVALPTF